MSRELLVQSGRKAGQRESVVLTLTTDGIDCRLWEFSAAASECRPTTVGVWLTYAVWEDVGPIVREAAQDESAAELPREIPLGPCPGRRQEFVAVVVHTDAIGLRVHQRGERNSDHRATSAGLALPRDKWPPLLSLIEAALEEVEATRSARGGDGSTSVPEPTTQVLPLLAPIMRIAKRSLDSDLGRKRQGRRRT